MIFDTHAHYDDEQFDEDREAMLGSLREHGIGAVVNVGASLESCRAALALAERYSNVYAAVGVHPDEVGTLDEQAFQWLREAASEPKVVAVGEIGLDYYWDKEGRGLQQEWFRRQLRLARELGLPVVIHSREAAADTWQVMEEEHLEEIGGVIHCFSYSWEMAQRYLDAGFYIGIGGVITFKNAKKLKEVVEKAPLERLVLETDCPYLAPVPHRGKRNSSHYLPLVAEAVAQLKGVTAETVTEQTERNARALYRLKEA